MKKADITRRLFLQGSMTYMAQAMARAGAPAILAVFQSACSAREEAASFTHLSEFEAQDVIAIAARILPTTATPGATEAGVVYFVDKALGSFLADSRALVRTQLAEFQATVANAFPTARFFFELSEKEQDSLLRTMENTPFFSGARFLTLAGVFGMSSWGGNKDDVGWRLVGMDGPPHAWAPPFGYYDAQPVSERVNGV